MKKAFYAGSFNPFTIGHADIVSRGLDLFDEVIIGVGINPAKISPEDIASRIEPIRDFYEGEPRVRVVSYSTLTTDAAEKEGAEVLLRSVRNVTDFEYERNLADVNRRISGMETIIMTARPELACVSSSLVRELRHFGKSAEEYIPHKK